MKAESAHYLWCHHAPRRPAIQRVTPPMNMSMPTKVACAPSASCADIPPAQVTSDTRQRIAPTSCIFFHFFEVSSTTCVRCVGPNIEAVDPNGRPHFGQEGAASETCSPQSGQVVSAMVIRHGTPVSPSLPSCAGAQLLEAA